ncbi:MAG: hypothetical protein ACKO23_00890 [Gemmataceae bacterium]
MATRRLSIKERKEIFQTLVTVQDQGNMSNSESKKFVGEQYNIEEKQIMEIVDEGIEKDWLDELVALN